MKKIIFISSFLYLFCATLVSASTQTNSPQGLWKTIDDVTGRAASVVEISVKSNNTLTGKLVKIYPLPQETPSDLCKTCVGKYHHQRIVGLTVIKNLKLDHNKPNEWSGGEILDPQSGKTYHCKIQVNGQKLIVRGYIGMPLFGRSQTWVRLNKLT